MRSLPFQTMSKEKLAAFLEAVRANAGLQEQLKGVGDADAVVAIAKAAGFVISAEELKRAQEEVSEEELEGVAGGAISYGMGLHCIQFKLSMTNIVCVHCC